MSKDDATWLNVAYVCFAVLAAYFAKEAVELLGIQLGWAERYDWYQWLAIAVGILIGISGTLYLRKDRERHEYFLAAIAELRKVTWPTWKDTKRMTVVVCVVVGFFAVVLGLFDVVWAKVLNLLIT